MKKPNILSIAGYDPSGGAGVLGDIKAIEASGGYGMGIISAHTAQSTNSVKGMLNVDTEFFKKQLDALLEEEQIDAMKIGLVGNLIDQLKYPISKVNNIVFDPIIFASSGFRFTNHGDIEKLVKEIFPKISLLTPNFLEAEIILEEAIRKNNMEEMVIKLSEKCQCSILLKGGHSFMKGEDVFYDGKAIKHIYPKTVTSKEAHGTGCALSASITTYLGKGMPMIESIIKAKELVYEGLINSHERKLHYGKFKGLL